MPHISTKDFNHLASLLNNARLQFTELQYNSAAATLIRLSHAARTLADQIDTLANPQPTKDPD